MASIDSVTYSTVSQQDSRVVSKTMTQNDFLKVMITELKQQDPSKAVDSSKFAEQFMQMGSFQAMQDVSTNIKLLQAQQSLQHAQSLVGKNVSVNASNGTVTAPVTSSRVDGADVKVTIGGTEYKATDIQAFY